MDRHGARETFDKLHPLLKSHATICPSLGIISYENVRWGEEKVIIDGCLIDGVMIGGALKMEDESFLALSDHYGFSGCLHFLRGNSFTCEIELHVLSFFGSAQGFYGSFCGRDF